MELIALNLPRDLNRYELENLFKAHGAVKTCTLVLDDKSGASKGFGFVEMASEEDAMNAIEKLHGSKVKKNKIRVKPLS